MSCPNCHSQAISYGTVDDGTDYMRCNACGQYFQDEGDAELEDDPCSYGDHDWRELEFEDGSPYAQCIYCGLIDA